MKEFRKVTKAFLLLCLVSFLFSFVFIGCDSNESKLSYMATTRWVAAITELAGLDNVKSFAPSNMTHPPEYELKPNDIINLSKAEVVFYAGYEKKMVEKINESLTQSENKFQLEKIKTENSLENLKQQALFIAKKFGTENKYKENIAEIQKIYDEMKEELKNMGLYGKDAYVHVFQTPMIKSLGFNIVGTFGPAPVNAEQIQEISNLKPTLIIDNYHNEVAKPLLEVSSNSHYVSFINFPGLFNTSTIKDVLLYAKKQFNSLKNH